MALPLPGSLTPSKVSVFKGCALAFRLSVIDKVPEPPSLQAFKGTVVHRALQLLMWEEPPGKRDPATALCKLARATEELLGGEEGSALALGPAELEELVEDTRQLVGNYFSVEDPNSVRAIGTELLLEVEAEVLPDAFFATPRLRLRGIIDRLDLGPEGELVITDYKTGRAPTAGRELPSFGGVHFYALLCQRLLGKRPARVQLLHLREPVAISTVPSEQSISGLEQQAAAIWDAIKRACLAEDFRPKPGPVCDRCGYHAYCPAMGGDLSLLASRNRQLAATGEPAQPELLTRMAFGEAVGRS
jgi:putative RecB family exonuclease